LQIREIDHQVVGLARQLAAQAHMVETRAALAFEPVHGEFTRARLPASRFEQSVAQHEARVDRPAARHSRDGHAVEETLRAITRRSPDAFDPAATPSSLADTNSEWPTSCDSSMVP
jgi:hypothetical protein